MSTVFGFGAATAANAADIYEGGGSLKDAPAPYVAPATWAGFYFGANVGFGFDDEGKCYVDYDFNGQDDGDNGSTKVDYCDDYDDDDDTFFLGGLHAGYNWQKHGPWVFGVEGDVSFGDDIDYLASIRGRVGYAMDSVLIYATGGAAFIGLEDGFGDSHSDTGWVVGGGAEFKVTQNMSFGLEGLYYDFGDNGDDYGYYKVDEEADFWTVRARVSYHLNRPYQDALK